MSQSPIPMRMSRPELLGDPCASTLRLHAEGLLEAASRSEKLIRNHPDVADDLLELQASVERWTGAVLTKLVERAGIPAEGESVSPAKNAKADYRIDRASGCWIWMRRVTRGGYPIIGRKTSGSENVPSRIYWELAYGRLRDDQVIARTCGMRLCINPEHGNVVDRNEHAAEQMRGRSRLSWDDVREIRDTLCASSESFRERVAELATRFGIGEHSIQEVFRNKVWKDREYVPGFEMKCAAPGCDESFRTTNATRKYHSAECRNIAMGSRSRAARCHEVCPTKSPERQAREDKSHREEADKAAAEWAEVVPIETRSSVWSVASLDQPIGAEGGILADVVGNSAADGDPVAELERKVEMEILDGLTEEQVEEMGEDELARVRAKLEAADVGPSTSRAV